MTHLPALIQDLGFILLVAGITTVLFKALKQPLVLGYIIAGIIVGPNFPFTAEVTDKASIQIWADIGVIILLFSLGLEFSFKKLAKVGGPSSITALVEIGVMMLAGYLIGKARHMPPIDCLFLSGIMGISSTTIILRTFDELGVKAKNFAMVVMGVLIIEDLVAILILVLLSTIAVTMNIEGIKIVMEILKLLFFLILWFVSGIYFVPTIFRKARFLMNDESLLVMSLGLCLLMVLFTTRIGFSSSLGAFLMGSILAETPQAQRIEHIVQPVKELFGAVFFVSVGMLIDPRMVVEHWGLILLMSGLLIVLKPIAATAGALLSGQPLKQSMQVGMTLSQIGEFSFIIASLGIALGIESNYLYPVAVSVATITTFTTPFMVKLSGPLYGVVESRLPRRMKIILGRYSAAAQTAKSESDWRQFVREYTTQLVVQSVILIAIVLLASHYIAPMIPGNGNEVSWQSAVATLVILIVMAPFLWALGIKPISGELFLSLSRDRRFYGLLVILRFVRVALSLFFIGFLVNNLFSKTFALMAFGVIVLVFILFRKRVQQFYLRIENRFLDNFNNKEDGNLPPRIKSLTPWDAHIAYFTILPESTFVGQTLQELKLREQLGINIALIRRGELDIPTPARTERIFPADVITVIGTDAQIEAFKSYLSAHVYAGKSDNGQVAMVLYSVLFRNQQDYVGKTILESGIREKTRGLVVGIERRGHRILNPESSVQIQSNDLFWIVGNEAEKKKFISSL